MGGIIRQRLASPPDLLALTSEYPVDFPFLLESSATSHLGRCSILFLAAGQALISDADHLPPTEFLGELKSAFSKEKAGFSPDDGDLPFRGGWFVYLGYEMAGAFEPTLNLPPNRTGVPDALAVRCPAAILVFHERDGDHAVLVSESHADAERILARMEQLERPVPSAREHSKPGKVAVTGISEADPDEFLDGVRRIHEYLLSGDVFQVNLSRGWRLKLKSHTGPLDIYRSLREANPAPFSGMMQWNGHTVLSSSPERLIEIRDGNIQTRPIAGTRPRNQDPSKDRELAAELIENVKERAEHIMLIDLERNDLGRVCEPGSVEVSELMVIESYAHVHHIVSNVTGKLRSDADPVDALAAVFPGGTITGCPKIRCMEIIAELEKEGRGFYTGSMGYLCRDGDLDMNILIRTMLHQSKNVTFRTGAGIVADSIPENELNETRDKARGLLLALGSGDR